MLENWILHITEVPQVNIIIYDMVYIRWEECCWNSRQLGLDEVELNLSLKYFNIGNECFLWKCKILLSECDKHHSGTFLLINRYYQSTLKILKFTLSLESLFVALKINFKKI